MTWAILVAVAVFAGTLISIEAGYRWGRKETVAEPLAHEGVGAVEAASFALLGLLLGFSFAGATSRMETKRELIVAEANAIGTAYLRIDLLPAESQPALREQFKQMLDARLRAYVDRADEARVERDLKTMTTAQERIWSLSIAASSAAGARQEVALLLLPAVNDMMDVGAKRAVALRTHLPAVIVVLLVSSAILSGLLVGYAMAKRRTRSSIHIAVYTMMLALTVYVVLDIDHPRFGLVRIDVAYQTLQDLRHSIK